jgi:hypothetical protein
MDGAWVRRIFRAHLLSIYGVRKLVELLLGKEVRWDILPIRYCADTVDFAVFLRFCWRVMRAFNEDFHVRYRTIAMKRRKSNSLKD